MIVLSIDPGWRNLGLCKFIYAPDQPLVLLHSEVADLGVWDTIQGIAQRLTLKVTPLLTGVDIFVVENQEIGYKHTKYKNYGIMSMLILLAMQANIKTVVPTAKHKFATLRPLCGEDITTVSAVTVQTKRRKVLKSNAIAVCKILMVKLNCVQDPFKAIITTRQEHFADALAMGLAVAMFPTVTM